MSPGYCTPVDVRKALQEKELTGDTSTEFVTAAIQGQSEWLQETSNRHWYDPDTPDGETDLYTSPLTHANDELSVPSTAHADQAQMQVSAAKQKRYPVRHAGPYTRVKLTRRDVTEITKLLIRDNSGDFTDWVSEETQGRGEDYYLQKNTHDGFSYLYLHTGTLPTLRGYGNAVLTTYDYGIEGITDTVRRAIALKAGAQLALDDDTQVGIPDSGQMVNLESKAQAMERQAEELLDIHM